MTEECQVVPRIDGWTCVCEDELGNHREIIAEQYNFAILNQQESIRVVGCPDRYALVHEIEVGPLRIKNVVSELKLLQDAVTAFETMKLVSEYAKR